MAVPLIGNAQTVVRSVLGVTDAAEQTIYVDSEIVQDEEIVTGPKSATRIIFKDGTNLEMGENSRLKLTKIVFDPDPAKSKLAVKAAIGVFRWTSGNLPHDAYEIGTRVATIGIRGTSLEFIVAESGLTTVALSRGAITVSNLKGDSVDLKPGEATTVLPPDADGNQQSPSAPGALSAGLQSVLWTMTVMIRYSDPPSDLAPQAGGNGSGGNHNFFSNASRPGDGPGDSGPVGNPFGNLPGPGFYNPVNPWHPTLGTSAPVTPFTTNQPGTDGPGKNDQGQANTGPGGNGPGGKGPGGDSCTASGTATTTALPKIDFGTITIGSQKQDTLSLNVRDGSITLTSMRFRSGDGQSFKVENFVSCTPMTGGALLIDFLPGAAGPFDTTLELFDTNNEEFDIELTGNAAPMPEPSDFAVFVVATGGLAWARRRRTNRP